MKQKTPLSLFLPGIFLIGLAGACTKSADSPTYRLAGNWVFRQQQGLVVQSPGNISAVFQSEVTDNRIQVNFRSNGTFVFSSDLPGLPSGTYGSSGDLLLLGPDSSALSKFCFTFPTVGFYPPGVVPPPVQYAKGDSITVQFSARDKFAPHDTLRLITRRVSIAADGTATGYQLTNSFVRL